MNSKTGSLLEDYRQADFTRRLHLFLEYPDLRADFNEIERQASALGQSAVEQTEPPKASRDCAWPRFLLPGLQRRFCR